MEYKSLFKQELNFLQNNLIHYLEYWPTEPEWKPTDSSFTFLALANHLYTLPAAYAALFKGAPQDELFRLWGGPWHGETSDDLRAILISGVADVLTYIDDLSPSASEEAIPWPFGEPLLPRAHVLNLITHMVHHRGQMHLYLKQMGAAVDTGTVYNVG